tara:strand:- start:2215 stop:2661 length:447 start_codon:yes stop_codon:yes gene_type:complete
VARLEAATRRGAAAEAAEAGHAALRRKLSAATGGAAEGGGSGGSIGSGEAPKMVALEGEDEGEGEGDSVSEGEGVGVGEGSGFYRKSLDVLGAVTVRAHVQVSEAASACIHMHARHACVGCHNLKPHSDPDSRTESLDPNLNQPQAWP